jgi:transcriptional regulator with XRE-family HTH domain
MHPVRIGRIVRALRRRRGWRQADLAGRVRVSQQAVSLVETGQCRRLAIATLERVVGALEAELDLNVRWRGGELDRVLDEGHAHLVASFAARLSEAGWAVAPEVTYSLGRDRGSVDLLALHEAEAALLVVEVKADVTSAEATLRRHDEKVRLGLQIAATRFGWHARSVSRLLVLPSASTPRRRVARHEALFGRAYPLRGRTLSAWIEPPSGAIGGFLFLPPTNGVGDRRDLTSRRRVRTVARARSTCDSPA